MMGREEVTGSAVARIMSRKRVLGAAYPFEVGRTGTTITFTGDEVSGNGGDASGQAAYLTCLVLSDLPALSPMLNDG